MRLTWILCTQVAFPDDRLTTQKETELGRYRSARPSQTEKACEGRGGGCTQLIWGYKKLPRKRVVLFQLPVFTLKKLKKSQKIDTNVSQFYIQLCQNWLKLVDIFLSKFGKWIGSISISLAANISTKKDPPPSSSQTKQVWDGLPYIPCRVHTACIKAWRRIIHEDGKRKRAKLTDSFSIHGVKGGSNF